MSAIADLVAFDGADTPVSHTFIPRSVTREKGVVVAEWRENIAGVPYEAQPGVKMSLEKLPSGVFVSEIRVEVPVMETITNQNAAGYTAAPKIAYVETVVMRGFHNKRSTAAVRKLVRGLAKNILHGNVLTSTVNTVGPAGEMFDLLVSPT